MANPIRVIGIGPGSLEYITPVAMEMIRSSDILIGGERVLNSFISPEKAKFVVKNNLKEMIEFIRTHYHDSNISVLASGDPAFYGILEFLKKNFSKSELAVYPGISSTQLACARLCISWHDAAFYSVHGRSIDGLPGVVKMNSKVIVLTDPVNTPSVIAKQLAEAGINGKTIFICENLSYEDERITECNINTVPSDVGTSGCVMVIADE